MFDNLVKEILEDKESLIQPIYIKQDTCITYGLCNGSLCYHNDILHLILRSVEYTLHCCEGEEKYQSTYEGPVSYYHKDNDLTLKTINYYCTLNPETLELESYNKINTAKHDKQPLWCFIGLEDARLVNWNNKYYAIGVRRDTTTNGQGRMEFSELNINLNANEVNEVNRIRIESPNVSNYCDKNWMPIKNRPFHFVRWTNPVEVVEANLDTKTSKVIYSNTNKLNFPYELRGGSHLVEWDNNSYLSIIHECDFQPTNFNGYKNANYFHRFVLWNTDFSIQYISSSFNFMSSKIEFCIGLEIIGNNVIIVFGYQDNSCYALKLKKNTLNNILWNKLKPTS
uniref:Uncharacterized protein n=1 Tax=viral metagenome TaxID=1070528 RepID=A0A6C0DX04_9ZZZZ